MSTAGSGSAGPPPQVALDNTESTAAMASRPLTFEFMKISCSLAPGIPGLDAIGRSRPANIAPPVRLPQSRVGSSKDHVPSPAIIMDIAPRSRHLMKLLRCSVTVALGWLVAACGSAEVRTADHYDPGQTPRAQFLREAANCDKQAETDQKQLGYGPYDPSQSTY